MEDVKENGKLGLSEPELQQSFNKQTIDLCIAG